MQRGIVPITWPRASHGAFLWPRSWVDANDVDPDWKADKHKKAGISPPAQWFVGSSSKEKLGYLYLHESLGATAQDHHRQTRTRTMSNPWHCSDSHTEAGLRPLDWCRRGTTDASISTDRASRCFDLTHAGLKVRRMGLAHIGEQTPHLVLTRACTIVVPITRPRASHGAFLCPRSGVDAWAIAPGIDPVTPRHICSELWSPIDWPKAGGRWRGLRHPSHAEAWPDDTSGRSLRLKTPESRETQHARVKRSLRGCDASVRQ